MLSRFFYNRYVRTTIKWAVFMTIGSLFWLLFGVTFAVLAHFI